MRPKLFERVRKSVAILVGMVGLIICSTQKVIPVSKLTKTYAITRFKVVLDVFFVHFHFTTGFGLVRVQDRLRARTYIQRQRR